MANKFIVAKRDFDNDRQEVSWEVSGPSTKADLASFVAAIDLWTVAANGGDAFLDEGTTDAGNAALTPAAQNSLQAIVELRDIVTGRNYTKRLPMPDLGKAVDVGLDSAFTSSGGLTVFNPDHDDYATLVAEIETHAISPVGNAVTVTRIYIEE